MALLMESPVNPIIEAKAKMDQAEQLRQQGKHDRARKICEELIRRYPGYVGALHTLGLVLADSGDFPGALMNLVRAAMLNPRDWRTLTALSGVYLKLGSHLMAARTLEQALKSKPNDVSTLSMLGQIYAEDEEYELASEAFRKVTGLEPSLHGAQIELGECYMHLGKFAEAALVFETLFHKGVRYLRVCYNLGQLPSSLSKIDFLPVLGNLSAAKNQDRQEFAASLAFTRASALDKAGRHDEAWKNLVVANRHKFKSMRNEYSKVREFRRTVLAELNQASGKPGIGRESSKGVPQSLFILGPSRSGKTSMERLVGTLNCVKRGYENSICDNVVQRVFRSTGLLTRDHVSALGQGMHALFREFYKEELAERAGGAEVFTITTPGLIVDAVAIAKVVPNARLIFIKRDIDDIAIRIFMKDYAAGNGYAYAIGTIHEYIRWYYDFIDACADRLPDVARVVRYEDLIEDPKAILNLAADLCGLSPYEGPVPLPGDDRGCGGPYKEFMAAALET
jgi:tetratricopeptide (TPR) repeat protein